MTGGGLVTFLVGDERWAADVDDVHEVVRLGALTRVPGTSGQVDELVDHASQHRVV